MDMTFMEQIRETYAHALEGLLEQRLHWMERGQSDHVEDLYGQILGVDQEISSSLLRKIVLALPGPILEVEASNRLRIQSDLLDDFIFFICQEDYENQAFGSHFAQFLEYMVADIAHKYSEIQWGEDVRYSLE